MNSIEAVIDKSDYEIYDDYLNFRIDDYWLDEKLDEIYPGHMFKGLVPTLLFWLGLEEEREVVWNRILPGQDEKSICPILMCADDCDFSCTLIVAEIENRGSKSIKWLRLGMDITKGMNNSEKGGLDVDWFDKMPTLEFAYDQYLEMIKEFKTCFDADKVEWKQDNGEKEACN